MYEKILLKNKTGRKRQKFDFSNFQCQRDDEENLLIHAQKSPKKQIHTQNTQYTYEKLSSDKCTGIFRRMQ